MRRLACACTSLIALFVACDDRPLPASGDGAPPPASPDGGARPERGAPRPDSVAPGKPDRSCQRPPGSCHSSADCPDDQVCSGCAGDPCCPMCDVCLGKCTPLPTGPCASNKDCPEGSFCEHDGLCVVTGGKAGVCRKRPLCADGGACLGVCGCDGKTYCSSCEAHEAGISVALAKACLAPSCAGLEAAYQAELAKAKSCCAMCASVQCALEVASSLVCGCATRVNAISPTLTAIKAEYYARSCQFTMPPCGIKCAPAGPAYCGGAGLCVDGGD